MLRCPGEGCKFTTKSDRAHTSHVGKCQKAKAGLALVAGEVEQRQAKRQRILSPEHPEPDLDSEESMVCPIKLDSWWMAYWYDYALRMRISSMIAHLQWLYLLHPPMNLDLLQGIPQHPPIPQHPSIPQHPFIPQHPSILQHLSIHLPLPPNLMFTELRKMNLGALGSISNLLH